MTTAAGDWNSLPQELRDAMQWCIAAPDRSPYAVVGGQVVHASVHNRAQWKTFEEALADALRIGGGAGVGFMLTYEDPWTVIDLDVVNEHTQRAKGRDIDPSKWTTDEEVARYQKFIDTFDTYTEKSSGGYGLHLWARGRIGAGARRDGVEVYSQERFIVCTGRSIHTPAKPIADRHELLENTVLEIRAQSRDTRTDLVEVEEEDNDMEVFDKLCAGGNAAKFHMLCEGKWHDLGFPSQSEADLALMSMFTFYSKSNDQCRRMFRCTALGKREKATKNDRYLNFTLEVIRGRQLREAMVSEKERELALNLINKMQSGGDQVDLAARGIANATIDLPDVAGSLEWPPGTAGKLAAYIYGSAPRPVKEVAIVAALGFLAGVCGKAYTIHQSGLNVYMILIARSAIGKEAMHSGIANILGVLRERIPTAERFVDFTEYVSGPALKKAISVNPSFCNVAGEFGRRLKRMADDGRDGPAATLRTVMTDLYQKSGPQAMVGGMGYSDREKNVAQMQGVAYSMIGETTPGTFYEALTQSMMEDGFLSRFTMVDYNGERPPANEATVVEMNPALVQIMQSICAQSMNLISRYAHQAVLFLPDAEAALRKFDKECDAQINGTHEEMYRQMWNRAHLKAARFSALLAVGDDWINPRVSLEHVEWALTLIRRDIKIMMSRISGGDVGVDDHAREAKMVSVLQGYMLKQQLVESYGCKPEMQEAGIVPKRFLQIRLSQIAAFRNARNGATFALDLTIKSLIELGYIAEVERAVMLDKFSYSGKAYRVVSLPPSK